MTFITIQNKSVLVHVCSVVLIVCLYICICECLLENNNHKTTHRINTLSNQHSYVRGPLRECRSIRSGASGLPYYCTTCMHLCRNWLASCVAAWHNKNLKTEPRNHETPTNTSRCVPLPVCDHSQGVYFRPIRWRSIVFRVLFQQTNKQNKQTRKWSVPLSLVRIWLVPVPVCAYSQGVYFPPNSGGGV